MNTADVARQLDAVAGTDFLYAAIDPLIAEWIARGADSSIVGPNLRFVEAHPNLDYGAPGPLVHYVERFFGSGYEDQLVASLKRKPTTLTVLMLNRWINGARSDQERASLLALLAEAKAHPLAADETRAEIAHFEEFQATKGARAPSSPLPDRGEG